MVECVFLAQVVCCLLGAGLFGNLPFGNPIFTFVCRRDGGLSWPIVPLIRPLFLRFHIFKNRSAILCTIHKRS